MKKLRWFLTVLNIWRIFPVWLIFKTNRFRLKCEKDLRAWASHEPDVVGRSSFWQFAYLLLHEKSCRNILLNRLHRNLIMWAIARCLFAPLESCYINMPPEKIGGGFSFQHGFSTIVSARELGENCRIYQQVTVGYHGTDAPTIGNDVTIAAGAIVIGGINVGDGARIGAGAVVTRGVQKGDTVVGVPARPISLRCSNGATSSHNEE